MKTRNTGKILKIKGEMKMRKMICGAMTVISFIGMTSILDLFDAGYISFGTSNVLILIFGLLFAVGLYGIEAFTFQRGRDENDKTIH